MELRIRSHLPFAFPAGLGLGLLVLVLVALLTPGDASAAKRAKPPTVSSVSPSKAVVGDRLTIRGRNFRAGKGRNTVVFKRDGGRALFVKADLSTRKMIRVTVPARLEALLPVRDGARQYAQFRIRVLSARLGRSFTPLARSPRIGMPIAADADCDGDGRTNRYDDDDDNDLLSDVRETRYRLLECDPDTDRDGVGDGYEFASARDLNDDEYQGDNTALPYPGARPYPNPLDGKDADTDFDGDSLTLGEEHGLWRFVLTGRPEASGTALNDAGLRSRFDLLDALSYSDGEQYSIRERCPSAANPDACGARDAGRRVPSLAAAGYDKRADFLAWAQQAGYRSVFLTDAPPWWAHPVTRNEYGLFDVDRLNGEEPGEQAAFDFDGDGFLSDDERDEDADGVSNYDETHGRLRPGYWTGCYTLEAPYPVSYGGTDVTNPDTDGDSIRDGADDQDHDDIPNLMELSRMAASHEDDRHPGKGRCTPAEGLPTDRHHSSVYGRVNPFNPCLPLGDPSVSRTCKRARDFDSPPAPFDGSPDWYALQ
ncbi:MAG: hypothetical protein AVDCRST_MAG38-481 [uncultured Solirubrobacteraceae bacterium]|uniref:IPT/TIG domain-containing protein n=1 Tax=uncultured Solirubrobacteraceae bacterium TaxID=1162706 RepID=A0A6J4R669_9ACTN|nr:MAG: hypothetical protein AVDCRST_MAG38-481 [uncultured Solirubrobacteraceae bacterium]